MLRCGAAEGLPRTVRRMRPFGDAARARAPEVSGCSDQRSVFAAFPPARADDYVSGPALFALEVVAKHETDNTRHA